MASQAMEMTTDAARATGARRGGGRRRIGRVLQRVGLPLLLVLLLLVVWEAWIVLGDVGEYLMPAPTDVAATSWSEFGALMPDTWVTLKEILLGFALSVVVGVALAIAIVSSRSFESAVYPLLVTSQLVPKVAIAPLIIVWFGFGASSKVLIAFSIAFFPVVIDTVAGLRSVEIEKLYLARSMGASRIQTFFKIQLPQALPSIFTGLKLSITFAVIGAVVGEFVASDEGLGRMILSASSSYDTPLMFTGVLYLTVIGLILFFAVEALERLLLPWHVSRRLDLTGGTT
jgi:NitT/TauT family transport system permease protein